MSLGRKLKRLIETQGALETLQLFNDAVKEKKIDPYSISFKDLAVNIVGEDYYDKLTSFNSLAQYRLRESSGGDTSDATVRVLESGAGEAVDASAFADITGQLLINEVRQKFESPEFVSDRLTTTVPITNGNLGTQKTPWLSDVLSTGQTVQPGMPYPHTKFVQQWQTYPAPVKKGEICSVTMEMLYSDLTSQAFDSAGSVGRALRYLKEQMVFDEILGVTNSFSFGNADVAEATFNTYQTAGTYWTNSIADEILVDWTNVNNVEQLFYKMVDPATGRRIYVRPNVFLTMPQLKYTAKRVLHATETRDGGATTAAWRATLANNPLDYDYDIVTSPIAYERLVTSGVDATKAGTYWHLIDKSRAFIWREVYGLRTQTAPKGNLLEFNQDIATQVKAGWYGVPATRSPFHVSRGYDA